jgi:hypothetical protein
MTTFLILALCVVALWAGSKVLESPPQSLIAGYSCLARSNVELLAKYRLSDNARSRQALFERTNPCTPKSAPFRFR